MYKMYFKQYTHVSRNAVLDWLLYAWLITVCMFTSGLCGSVLSSLLGGKFEHNLMSVFFFKASKIKIGLNVLFRFVTGPLSNFSSVLMWFWLQFFQAFHVNEKDKKVICQCGFTWNKVETHSLKSICCFPVAVKQRHKHFSLKLCHSTVENQYEA